MWACQYDSKMVVAFRVDKDIKKVTRHLLLLIFLKKRYIPFNLQ